MRRRSGCVIVGAGLAGAKAAETLRAEGFDGRVTLLGDEPDRPYERPPLTKGYLQGTAERESVFVHSAGWYDAHDVDLRLGVEVAVLDRVAREVVLTDGVRIGYDALLLATGSRPQRLHLPGADLRGVHYLRRLGDADALKEALASAHRVAVVGGGWIGLEVAAAARTAGLDVTLVEQTPLPLQRVLGPEVARIFARLHRDHGVGMHCRVELTRLLGTGGRLEAVELDDGSRVEADLAVVGIGITPTTALAEAAWLDVANGVRVDEHLRTSDPAIHAAGDVANAFHPLLGRHIRVEHWGNALHQGPVAARSMLGQDVVYDRLPYFFTDQYDLSMEYTGYADPGSYDEVVLRGDVRGLRFIAFWLSNGRVVAGMPVNTDRVVKDVDRLIRSGRRVDRRALAAPDVPIRDL
jgi:3-phenylpropionate/trans-cinnamate dioxygenase ferredoxin reductase subunit